MTRKLNPLTKTLVVAGIASLCGLAVALAAVNVPFKQRGPPPALFLLVVRAEVFVTTFNLVAIGVLTISYVSLYRDLPNKYTRSLVVLSLALLLYSLSSHPFVSILFGYPPCPDLGPFVFLPDVFVGIAAIVLFYQSQT